MRSESSSGLDLIQVFLESSNGVYVSTTCHVACHVGISPDRPMLIITTTIRISLTLIRQVVDPPHFFFFFFFEERIHESLVKNIIYIVIMYMYLHSNFQFLLRPSILYCHNGWSHLMIVMVLLSV